MVGGGSSGSVVAARLSEEPDVTVLLLEAGGQESEFSEVPGLAGYLQLSQMDWQYKAEPSTTSCLAMVSNRFGNCLLLQSLLTVESDFFLVIRTNVCY